MLALTDNDFLYAAGLPVYQLAHAGTMRTMHCSVHLDFMPLRKTNMLVERQFERPGAEACGILEEAS